MSFASLSKETRKLFGTGDFVSRHLFAAGDFVSRQQPFFFRASFGTCTFAINVPSVAFVGSLVLVSDLFGLCLGKSLTTVCLVFVGSLGVSVGVESRFFGMGLLVVQDFLSVVYCLGFVGLFGCV